MDEKPDLDQLRQEIGQVDRDIMALIGRRLELAEQVGQAKLEQKLPIKNYQVEKLVIARNRKHAESFGAFPELAEEISKLLIHYAVATQDEKYSRSRRSHSKEEQRVLIVGGRGRMGQWLAQFFDSFDHQVTIFDPFDRQEAGGGGAKSSFPQVESLEEALNAATVVVLATPILETAKVFPTLIQSQTKALIFDICSLKSPLLGPIEEARKAGLHISSIHPMFGPEIRLLAGQNVLICDCGDQVATDRARKLFEETTANLIELTVQVHDEFVGNVLGLSHLTNLLFAHALSKSGIQFKELTRVGSTTFNAQQLVSEQVVNENQDLYYEIQAENNVTGKIVERLHESLSSFANAIQARNRDEFKALMEASRDYFRS
jgi:chorismate mutase / prephenate dehydrogenase